MWLNSTKLNYFGTILVEASQIRFVVAKKQTKMALYGELLRAEIPSNF